MDKERAKEATANMILAIGAVLLVVGIAIGCIAFVIYMGTHHLWILITLAVLGCFALVWKEFYDGRKPPYSEYDAPEPYNKPERTPPAISNAEYLKQTDEKTKGVK